jgi:hypothetical protein
VLCCALQLLEAGGLERLLSNPTSIKEAIVFAAATGAWLLLIIIIYYLLFIYLLFVYYYLFISPMQCKSVDAAGHVLQLSVMTLKDHTAANGTRCERSTVA